jgi:flagellar biosynthetic protein FliP
VLHLKRLVVLAALAGALIVPTLLISPAAAQTPPEAPVAPAETLEDVATVGAPGPADAVAPQAAEGGETRPGMLQINLTGQEGEDGSTTSQPLVIVLLITLVALAPAMLILLTSFTRIVIVLGLTRNALNLQGVPPNQVLIGLALFLTLFVMGPVFTKVNEEAVQPFLDGEIEQSEAFERGIEPFRTFMFEHARERDIALFIKLSGQDAPEEPEDVSTTTLIPAFVISELRAAFLIGFVIFVPFLVIDMVVSAALMSMGMVMLPPVIISLPFKLLLFVVVDGWFLVVQSLVRSF